MSNALMILIDRKKDQAEVILKEQTKIKKSLEIAQQKLRMLNDYQLECEKGTNKIAQNNSLNCNHFRNHFIFSVKIQDAINQQLQEISILEKNINETKKEYQQLLIEIKKFEFVINRKRLLHEKQINKNEQKQNDEFSARVALKASLNKSN